MEMFSGDGQNREIHEELSRALEDEIALCAHLERLTHKDQRGLERLRTIRQRISDLEGLLETASDRVPQPSAFSAVVTTPVRLSAAAPEAAGTPVRTRRTA